MDGDALVETTELTPEQTALKAEQEKLKAVLDAAEAKALTITERLNKRIVPIVMADYVNPGEYVIGFMYRPDLTTQLRLGDKGQAFATGFSYEEASKVLQALLITGESDPRINMETEEGEMFWKGAILVIHEFTQAAMPILKKK